AGGRGGAAAPVAGEHRAMDRRRALVLAVAWSAAAAPATVQAQREPVLKQVGVPHAYYWREMYVPQVTSGPSAITWSPDGTELIYSMQGSLWRQRIGSRVAQQLTAGEGYDYQPDWSPDGRLIVFARYAHDAIELQLLDLAAQTVRPVTANGAVNVEPRWSPDGTRIAFVSSAYNRRWHIFTVAMAGGTPAEGTVTRLTEDNDSRLPRYYYSAWDQYLSPTWSPDGRELIIVSNREHIHGTGGFWRMKATPGAPLRELRYEETAWKARPDWAPDGPFDRPERGFEYGYFHTSGTAELTVPAGAVRVEVWHGPEYHVARGEVTVTAGRTATQRLVLERLVNLPARDWWSGDLHVHMNYGGAYRNTPEHLAFQSRAEDLHVVENLIVNKEQRIPDIAYFRTDPDPA